MLDLETLQTYLTEARTALHMLMTGQREVQVKVMDYGETTFSQVTRRDLEKYIANLENQIARCQGKRGRSPLLIRF